MPGGEMPEGFDASQMPGFGGDSGESGSSGFGGFPGGGQGSFPGGDFSANLSREGSTERPDRAGFDSSSFGGGSAVSTQDWLWVGISVAVLLVGLLIGFKAKRH